MLQNKELCHKTVWANHADCYCPLTDLSSNTVCSIWSTQFLSPLQHSYKGSAEKSTEPTQPGQALYNLTT